MAKDWIETGEYDEWKTTDPDYPDSKIKCCKCGDSLFCDDEYYELDDEFYCEYCAGKWLEGHKNYVTEDMATNGR